MTPTAQLSTVEVLAVVVVRDGVLPAGAAEVTAEAGGDVLLAGSGAGRAVPDLVGARRVWWCEPGTVAPGALAAALAPVLLGIPVVLLPTSADGRDLAPRLAALLDRPLLGGAVRCGGGTAELARADHRLGVTVALDGPVVVTLEPGPGALPASGTPEVREIGVVVPGGVADAELVEVQPPDPATMDLTEAGRILGGGAGLVPAGSDVEAGRATMRRLAAVAAALGASAGATRVVTDAGWMDYARQIGTTGVVTRPRLYAAFGVSGAAQHLGGLGHPEHVVSVNLDPSCPMTAMADLGIVADAPAVLAELAARLGAEDGDD